jgi:hypothetical protein
MSRIANKRLDGAALGMTTCALVGSDTGEQRVVDVGGFTG